MNENETRGFWARLKASPRARMALWGLAALLALGLTFMAGVAVGARGFGRAPFFAVIRSGEDGLLPKHGLIGEILTLDPSGMQVQERQTDIVRAVSITADTVFERGRGNRIKFQELSVGDRVFVIGLPVDHVIQARFVGVMIPPPNMSDLPRWRAKPDDTQYPVQGD